MYTFEKKDNGKKKKMATTAKQSCKKCNKNINLRTQKHIFCEGACQKVWHVPKCSSVSEREFEEIVKNSDLPWLCESCKIHGRQRRSVMTDLASTATTPQTPLNSAPNQGKIPSVTRTTGDPQNDDTLKTILTELKSLREQQSKSNATLTDLKTIMNDYKSIMDNIIQENIELRNEIATLHKKLNNIDHLMDTKDQKGLEHNLVINGATEEQNEVVPQIVVQIATALNVSIEASDIKTATRRMTANEESGLPRSIIVEFKNKSKRDEILERRKTTITTQCLQLSQINNKPFRPIYIAEHLTSRKQFIFKMARDIKRAKQIKFAWARNGDIFVRQSERSKIIKIKHIQQLKQFQDELPTTDE